MNSLIHKIKRRSSTYRTFCNYEWVCPFAPKMVLFCEQKWYYFASKNLLAKLKMVFLARETQNGIPPGSMYGKVFLAELDNNRVL